MKTDVKKATMPSLECWLIWLGATVHGIFWCATWIFANIQAIRYGLDSVSNLISLYVRILMMTGLPMTYIGIKNTIQNINETVEYFRLKFGKES